MTIRDNNLLPFTNDFIFSMVMRNPEICKSLLERILPDEEFSEIKLSDPDTALLLEDLLNVDTQNSLKFGECSHGVRFDAYITSKDMWAEIEMQTYSRVHAGKRSRYYHANMDMDFLEAGQPYEELKKSYVIFICTFDYMKKGAPIYHFRSYDPATDICLDDECHTIILNTACPLDIVPDKLKPLYAYIRDASNQSDDFIRTLDSYVRKYNSTEWRQRQLTLEHLIEKEREKTAYRINQLNQRLAEAGRIDDLIKSTTDATYQKKLFQEFDL